MLWSRHKIAGPRLAPKQFERFVEGYGSVRKLTDDERRTIPYFVLCREIFIMGVALQSLNRFPRRPGEDPVASCVDFVKRWIDDHNLNC
jgi:Ser/Thr protein kinase RdoA (MazF antagonist)